MLFKNIEIRTYSTKILLVVLYGRETLSLTLREERRLRVFENRALRIILGPKREEVIGGWRKLYTEELQDFHSSHQNDQAKENEISRTCSTYWS
jgi:hypothetical protein